VNRTGINLGTLVGHVFQAIRSRITYFSFVYGFEAIFIFGLVSLAVTLEIFEWPREIAVFVAIGGLLNNVLGKLKGSMSIVSKWFSYKVAPIQDKELLKLDKGPQWNSSRGVFFKAQDNPRTQQTLFWTDQAVNSYLTSNQDFFAELKNQDYELPKLLRQMAPVALKSSNVKTGRRKLPIRFNGKLVRLATEPTLEQLKSSNLELQKVSYFDGECSNEILKFRDLKAGGVSPVEQFTFDREKSLRLWRTLPRRTSSVFRSLQLPPTVT